MKARGFTIIEVMIAITILGILAAIAAPAFNEMIANQRVKDAAFELHATMMLGRSEALKRNTTIRVVPVGGDWLAGWIMANPAYAGTQIDQRGALPPTLSVATCNMGAADNRVAFSGIGRLDTSAHADAPWFEVSNSVTATKRCVRIELSGRAATSNGACPAC